jgi:tetratricopeptide (TPR) repeat protein
VQEPLIDMIGLQPFQTLLQLAQGAVPVGFGCLRGDPHLRTAVFDHLPKAGFGLPSLEQARLLQGAGILAYLQNDYEAAHSLHQQALDMARGSNDNAMIANALHGISNAAMNLGRFAEVEALLEECLPHARSTAWELSPNIAAITSVHRQFTRRV